VRWTNIAVPDGGNIRLLVSRGKLSDDIGNAEFAWLIMPRGKFK